MSGLYNSVFGVNPLAGTLLGVLGIDHKAVPRFRDCFLNTDGTEIIIYTRTGGGNNRTEYEKENEALRALPGYISDQDETFDSTYALFRFKIPDTPSFNWPEAAAKYGVDPTKRWEDTMRAMQDIK